MSKTEIVQQAQQQELPAAQQVAGQVNTAAKLGYLDQEAHFGVQGGVNTGGKTGSSKITSIITGENYQVKKSINQAESGIKNFARKIKANWLDSENFSQFFGSAVLGANMDSANEPKLVDNVELVYDRKEHEIGAASQYLQGVTHGSLDRYAQEKYGAKLQEKSKHVLVSFTGQNEQPGDFNLQEKETDTTQEKHQKALLRNDIARNLAGSILVGNHDFNPGNMVPLKEQSGNSRVAQVDLGHAFNELLDSFERLGGRVRNKDNMVLDFLNREQIVHAYSENRVPKLWRDYENVVLSPELVTALKEFSSEEQIAKTTEGIVTAKAKFTSLIEDLEAKNDKSGKAKSKDDIKGDKNAIDHIKKSLIAVSNNVEGNIKINASSSIHQVLEKTCQNLEKFCATNQKQMKEVAVLIDIQLKVDKLLAPQISPEENKLLRTEISQIYEELIQKPEFIARDKKGEQVNGIQWVKTDRDALAFQGTSEEYILARTNKVQLQNLQKKIDTLIIDEQLTGVRNNDLCSDITAQYEQFTKKDGVGLGNNKGIKWQKDCRNEKPIEGTLEQYINKRGQSAQVKSILEDKRSLSASNALESVTNQKQQIEQQTLPQENHSRSNSSADIIEGYSDFAESRKRSYAISLTTDVSGTSTSTVPSQKLSRDVIKQAINIGNNYKEQMKSRQGTRHAACSKASQIQR